MFANPRLFTFTWAVPSAARSSDSSTGVCRALPTLEQRLRVLVDRTLALLLLIATAPLMLVGALLVKLSSPGPAIYSQIRMGKGRRPFVIYKLRTMKHNCEKATGAQWCVKGDPRITRVGTFLRKTHIDELPQLWNILRGDMSLVGPRPERPEFVAQLERVIPRYAERLAVLPGLTGLAQVQLPPDTDVDSVRRKLLYDLHAIKHGGLALDLKLIAATAVHVLGVPGWMLCLLFRIPDTSVVEGTVEVSPLPSLCPQPSEAAC